MDKIRNLTILFIFFSALSFAQNVDYKKDSTTIETPFKKGEWLKFRLHYGMLDAGYATLEVKDENEDDNLYNIKSYGWTIGMFKWFFKVEDHYNSDIDKNTLLPNKFNRDVLEGGYTINREITFDRENRTASVKDKKEDERADSLYTITPITGDMISSFYYARHFNADTLSKGDIIYLDVFMDYKIFNFHLKFLGRENLETNFGKIKCLKLAPLVQSGRVFKDDESVILWVSDDKNKIPVRIKSNLRVGSIKVDLEAFRGLKYPFKIIVEKK